MKIWQAYINLETLSYAIGFDNPLPIDKIKQAYLACSSHWMYQNKTHKYNLQYEKTQETLKVIKKYLIDDSKAIDYVSLVATQEQRGKRF